MGEGWIRVDAKALRTDAALGEWLQAATSHLDRRTAHRAGRKASTASTASRSRLNRS